MEQNAPLPTHKSPIIVPILSQINPIETLQLYFPQIYFNIFLPPTPTSSWQFSPLRTSIQNFTGISHLRHACNMPHQFFPHDLIILTFGGYKLWSSLLLNFLQLSVTSYFPTRWRMALCWGGKILRWAAKDQNMAKVQITRVTIQIKRNVRYCSESQLVYLSQAIN